MHRGGLCVHIKKGTKRSLYIYMDIYFSSVGLHWSTAVASAHIFLSSY